METVSTAKRARLAILVILLVRSAQWIRSRPTMVPVAAQIALLTSIPMRCVLIYVMENEVPLKLWV